MDFTILQYPDPRLARKAEAVSRFDQTLRSRVDRLIEVMYESRGVGLAAPQVGWSARLFVANCAPEQPPGEICVFINPVLELSEAISDDTEGCLSFPGLVVSVPRPEEVVVCYQNLDGQKRLERHTGLWSRCIQHEYDHLEGVLLSDRMPPAERVRTRPTLKRWERDFKRHK